MPKTKSKKERLSILIVREGKTEPISLQIPKWLLRTVISLVSMIFIIFVSAGIFYYLSYNKIAEFDKVKSQNDMLLENQEKITSIIDELSHLKQTDQRIRELFGLEIDPQDGEDNGKEKGSIDAFISQAGLKDFDLLQKNSDSRESKFRSVPTLQPVDGFVSKGFKEGDPDHLGIDIVTKENSSIRAAADGVVIFSGWNDNYGNIIIIDHGNGYITEYKHNKINKVKTAEFVYRGQMISLLGNSGTNSSGPHLHFEIWQNGKPIDPSKVLLTLKNRQE